MNNKNSKKLVSLGQTMGNKTRSRCFKCNKVNTYENPLIICKECKNMFCYDDANFLQVNNKTKMTDDVRKVCDDCKEKHGYKTLGQ